MKSLMVLFVVLTRGSPYNCEYYYSIRVSFGLHLSKNIRGLERNTVTK